MPTVEIAPSLVAPPSLASSRARQRLLMCAPDLYEVDYVINPWMEGQVHATSRERAARQWTALYQALSPRAEVTLAEPHPASPDMVFTANAGLALPRGEVRTVAPSRFFHPERQGEEP